MRVEFLIVQLNTPVEILDASSKSAEIAAQSLKLHGGNIYPILPKGKLETFLKENYKEELS